ncbi:MAG: peptidoglycan editing factor PgeF [Saprospiraceae bacterium]|nr:peptidoglycan editing factor PgeF [Saprospiraceae bacterium]
MILPTDLLIRPTVFDAFPELKAAQSTRHGGVSPAPYNSLNLGKSTDDDPANVAENRRRFCHAIGFRPEQTAWSKQVHGTEIKRVKEPGGSEGFDAFITNAQGILLCVSIADCTPILIYDAGNKVLGAVHAGWKGAAGKLVRKTLEKMSETFGTQGAQCYAFVGACIDECSFEVGEEVALQFKAPFKRFDPEKGKYFVDLKQDNRQQCLDFGIPASQIEVSPYSTYVHHQHFFSHRKDKGVTGRGMAVIGLME